MFFYKKLEKEKKEKNPLTAEEEQRKDLIKNAIIIILLIAAVAAVIFVANKLKVEINDYNSQMDVNKDVSDMTDGITPLYKEDTETKKASIDINNDSLYESITDKVYNDYDKHFKEYNNLYTNENLDSYSYIEFEYTYMNTKSYYYIYDNKLYTSDTQINNIEDFNQLTVKNENVENILNLIKLDIPKDFTDYLNYLINIEYYRQENNIDFDLKGKIYLNDDTQQDLSLEDFVEISMDLVK